MDISQHRSDVINLLRSLCCCHIDDVQQGAHVTARLRDGTLRLKVEGTRDDL